MVGSSPVTGIVIVGAGPAGLAPLFAAAANGHLEQFLRLGVTVLEQGSILGSGALPAYAIESDSSAEAFLDIVLRTQQPRLQALLSHPVTVQLLRLGKQPVPLALVASFLQIAAEALCQVVADAERCQVLKGVQAISVTQDEFSGWRTRYRNLVSGAEYEIRSDAVVLATGAHQPLARLETETVAGIPLWPQFKGKTLQSGVVLSRGGIATVQQALKGRATPKVVVLGGSTSAGSVAAALLAENSGLTFGPHGVTLMHRKPLRIFYESIEEALGDGYTQFSATDVCPITGRLNRLGGLRSSAKDVVLANSGLGYRGPDGRLRLFHLGAETAAEASHLMEEADLLIACFGYRPRLLPAFDAQGHPLPLFSPEGTLWSVVDGRCRVLNSTGRPLDGLFALGLAVGPTASRELGGEANFRGQVNSLWMWQHTLGSKIVEELIAGQRPRQNAREAAMAKLGPMLQHPTPAEGVQMPTPSAEVR